MMEEDGRAESPLLTKRDFSLSVQYDSVAVISNGTNSLLEPVTDQMNGNIQEEEEASSEGFSCARASRVQILTYICIGLVNFTSFCGYSIITPFFPGEALKRGASQTTVGLIIGIYAIIGMFSGPFFGKYITSIGSRFMLIAGLMLSGGCTVLSGFLQYTTGTTFIVLCFAVRAVDALAVSASMTSGTTILIHAFPNNVATVMGTLEIFTGLGLMSGPPVGAFLYELGGYRLPFWVIGGILLLCGVSVLIIIPSQPDEEEDAKQPGSLSSLLKLPVIIFTCGLCVAISLSIAFLEPILQPYLKDTYKLSPSHIGLLFLLYSAVYAVLAPFWGWLADKKKAMRVMIVAGLVILSVGAMLVAPSPLLTDYLSVLPKRTLWVIIVGLTVMSVGCGMAAAPIFNEMLLAASDAGMEDNFATNGLVSGIFNAGFSFGEFIGPTASSALVEHFNFAWASTGLGGFDMFYVTLVCHLEKIVFKQNNHQALVMVVFYISLYCCKSERQHRGPSTEEENRRLLP